MNERQHLTLTGEVPIPAALRDLPVAKRLAEIPFEKRFIVARAATGSGKTLLLAPYEILTRKLRGEPVRAALRVPTKTVSGFLVPTLREMWTPFGLKVAELNRDVSEAEERLVAQADFVVISDGSLPRLLRIQPALTHYFADEIHQPSLGCELDLALAKIKGLHIRLMSATVDPENLLEYLPGAANIEMEGRSFPITKGTLWGSEKIFKRSAPRELEGFVQQFVERLAHENKAGIVFMLTRQQCDDLAERFSATMPAKAIHGGISPKESEAWARANSGKPFVVFCTVAAATGVTLNVDEALLTDEMLESNLVDGQDITTTQPLDNNLALQMAGRVGRLRPGTAWLLTNKDLRGESNDPWESIVPTRITPPSEKATPYEVVLAMAHHGITRNEDIDILGQLKMGEISGAREWLQRTGCLDMDGKPTRLGNRVHSFPLSTREAHAVLTAPTPKHQLALFAAFCLGLGGTFHITERRSRDKLPPENRPPLLPSETVVFGSVPLSLAKLMQHAMGVQKDAVYAWCQDRHLSAKSFYAARKRFSEGSELLVKMGAKSTFIGTQLEDPEFSQAMHDHLARHPLYRASEIFEGGRWGERTLLADSLYADVFGMSRDCAACGHANDHNPRCGKYDPNSGKCPCNEDRGQTRFVHHVAKRKHIRRAIFSTAELFFFDPKETPK